MPANDLPARRHEDKQLNPVMSKGARGLTEKTANEAYLVQTALEQKPTRLYAATAAARRATMRAWRKRQRARKAAKLAAERDDAAGADVAA